VPKVFLSSTIYDLRDLRSAIKYWLEQSGFDVLASEFSDFPHALDREAIAAALKPIAGCDYYVLLVGTRVGQVLAEEDISVTRAEFRHARELRRKTGRPQMLHLVRREIYEARQGARPESVKAEDWPRIVSFLKEVGDKGEHGDPNWVSKFDDFRQVVDVLRATLNISGPLVRRALEANLVWELEANTRELLGHTKASGLRPHAIFYPEDLTIPSGLDEKMRVDSKDAGTIFIFRIMLRPSLGRSALEECIHSGAFLDYDARTSSFVVGPMQRALLELRQQLQTLEGLVNTINTHELVSADVTQLAAASRDKHDAYVTTFTARLLYGAWSATVNILRLNRTLYRVLTGASKALETPTLTPIHAPDEDERMKAEEISQGDAATWLRVLDWRVPRAT
jgi:hypothetical protein